MFAQSILFEDELVSIPTILATKEEKVVYDGNIIRVGKDVEYHLSTLSQCPRIGVTTELIKRFPSVFPKADVGSLIDCQTFKYIPVFSLPAEPTKTERAIHLQSVNWFVNRPLTLKQVHYIKTTIDLFITDPIGQYVVIDIETNNELDPRSKTGKITKIIVKDLNQPDAFIFDYPNKTDIDNLMWFLYKRNVTLIGHNIQFDIDWLCTHSTFRKHIPVIDTMLLAHNRGEYRLGLKFLTFLRLNGMEVSTSYGSFDSDEYAAQDVYCTEALYKLYSLKPIFMDTVTNLCATHFVHQRVNGVYVDKAVFENQLQVEEEEITSLCRQLNITPQDVSNVNKLADYVQSRGITLTEKTNEGRWKLDHNVLVGLQKDYGFDWLQQLERVIYVANQKSTFTEPYIKKMQQKMGKWFLYPTQRIDGTVTGRTSMESPNLQQVPSGSPLKYGFSSRFDRGLMATIDNSQAELKVLCYLANCLDFAKAFACGDVHTGNAAILLNKPIDEVTKAERKAAKIPTFGAVYGKQAVTEEAQRLEKAFYSAFPRLKPFLQRAANNALNQLQTVDLFGRVRSLEKELVNLGRGAVRRRGQNTLIQSLASHLALLTQAHMHEYLADNGAKSLVLFGIHDAVYVDVYPGEVDLVLEAAKYGFKRLNDTPIAKLYLWNKVVFSGDLLFAANWGLLEKDDVVHSFQVDTL